MKIHNPGDIDLSPTALRQMVEQASLNLDPREVLAQEAARRSQVAQQQSLEQSLQSGAGRNAPAVISRNEPMSRGGGSREMASPESAAAWRERRSADRAGEGRRSYEVDPTAGRQQADAPVVAAGPTAEEREHERSRLARRLKLIQQVISECQALELLNVDVLQMSGYPGAAQMLLAKRRSNLLWLGALLCLGVFLTALMANLNPWLAGSLLGGAVLLTALQIGPVRSLLFSDSSYSALQARRKSLEAAALNHIRMLEGRNGLAYQCQMMSAEFEALSHRQFGRLILLSRKGLLLKAMRHAGAIRLYLRYMMLSRAAYLSLKRDYVTINHRLRTEFGDLQDNG
ncbi:hypothetical protein [Allohahella marinimesophila]|uniref:Uncharacterized protein n=1 Tax=Allohahella marinimesophila TaxID=1054972 RepID=A0ABP7Q9K6_9GAMM